MLEAKRYVPLSRAAKHFDLSTDEFCIFILENRIPLYADSDYVRPEDSDEPHRYQIKLSSVERVLAADQIVETVEFLYPPAIRRLRLKARPTDDQKIGRKNLYILSDQLDSIQLLVETAVGYKWSKSKRSRIKNKNTRIKSLIGQGSHWEATRLRFLSAANVELRANFQNYEKPNGKVNYSDLSVFLDENRPLWGGPPDKNARGFEPKRIAEWLSRFDKQGLLHYPEIEPK